MELKGGCALAIVFFANLAISSSPLGAKANASGSIADTVSNSCGAVLPGIRFSLENQSRGSEEKIGTSWEDAHCIDLTLPGEYSVKVSSENFQNTARHVEVALGQVVTVENRLSLGASSMTAEVGMPQRQKLFSCIVPDPEVFRVCDFSARLEFV